MDRLARVLLLSLLAVPAAAIAQDPQPDPSGDEAPGAIAGGKVKSWDVGTQTLIVTVSKREEQVLHTASAVIHGQLAVGRIIDVTYSGDRATVIRVRP